MQQLKLDPKVPNIVTNVIDGVPKSCGCNEEDEDLEKMTARRRKGKKLYNLLF